MEGQYNSIIEKFAMMRKVVETDIGGNFSVEPASSTFEEIMQKEDEINYNRQSMVDNFFEFMENKFCGLFHYIDVTEIKQKLKDIENLINMADKDSLYFDHIIENLKELKNEISALCTEKTTKENLTVLKNFTYGLKCFSEKLLSGDSSNKNIPMSHKKILFSEKRSQELQNLNLGEIFVKPSKRIMTENFLQIFFIKENGIFSNSYISNCTIDKTYKRFNFYKVKICISKTESMGMIKSHIEFIKKLFNRFILFYIENPNKKFIKLIICGSGLDQRIIKNSLKNFLKENLKNDSLIKINFYTNIYSSILPSLRKYNSSTFYHSELTNSLYNKLISLI
jgi:hypothetical protein